MDDYWKLFVTQAERAYNDALARGEPFGAVSPPEEDLAETRPAPDAQPEHP